MTESYKTVKKDFSSVSFTEKKSEFISYVARIETEQDALDFVRKIKEKHKDATHNVYAYVVKGTQIARASDDGEPQGTAGMPVLEVIKREGIVGVCIVVTRYFGGILLGAGGLIRAYAKSAKLGLDNAQICVFTQHITFDISLSYSDYERVSKDLDKYSVFCQDTEFTDKVTMHLSTKQQNFDAFCVYIKDLGAGKYTCVQTGTVFAPEN